MKTIIQTLFVLLFICSQLISIELSANGREVPVPDFEADLTLITAGSSVNFADLTSGDALSWEWTFEGGNPSTYSGQVPPPVFYETAGDWDVELIVYDGLFNYDLTKTDYIQVVDYPAGWDYTPTGTSHIISVPAAVTFYSVPLVEGDFIGAFYLDENGFEKCGGANVWDGVNNIAVLAFGNDATTTAIKEGFNEGESFIWKVYFTGTSTEKHAFVTYNTALPNHNGNFYDNGLSSLTSIDTDPLTVNATADPEGICLGDEVQLNAEVGGGTQNYSFAWTSVPAGFTSNLQNPVDSPAQSTKYFVAVDDGNRVAIDSVLVVINSPTAYAGINQSTCEANPVTLSGTATNFSSVFWSTAGDGLFTNQNQLAATYTAGINDIANASVELTLTAQAIDPCTTTATSTLTITIVSSATADAGGDMEVCSNAGNTSYQLDATVTNALSILWETDGDGEFDLDTIEDPVYTPGETDLLNGSVVLTIAAESFSPCTAIAEDQMTMTFVFEAEAFAGNDAEICPGESYELLEATADNYSGLLWETNGDGGFDNDATLNPVYTPGEGDIAAGTVDLCITAQALDPCTFVANSCMTLTIFDSQAIIIPAGWSGISSYLDPTNPDIEVLMAAIADDLLMMYNAAGELYKPAFGENTIVDWNSFDGYYVKLDNEVTLNICGSPVENKTLNLVEGWNVIPVLSDVDVAVADVFDAVSDKVVVIQEIAGAKLWYPGYSIYSLEMLITGKAYLVKVNEDVEITFP
jgi:hypothetical protein